MLRVSGYCEIVLSPFHKERLLPLQFVLLTKKHFACTMQVPDRKYGWSLIAKKTEASSDAGFHSDSDTNSTYQIMSNVKSYNGNGIILGYVCVCVCVCVCVF